MSDSLQPHELQHARPPCPSPTPGVHSDSRPSSQWCHPAISSSVVPFSSCPQSLPASESFLMRQLFAWGGQRTGVSALASFLPKKSQGWSPCKLLHLEWINKVLLYRARNYIQSGINCNRKEYLKSVYIHIYVCVHIYIYMYIWFTLLVQQRLAHCKSTIVQSKKKRKKKGGREYTGREIVNAQDWAKRCLVSLDQTSRQMYTLDSFSVGFTPTSIRERVTFSPKVGERRTWWWAWHEKVGKPRFTNTLDTHPMT